MANSEKLSQLEQRLTTAVETGVLPRETINHEFDWIKDRTKAHLKLVIYLKPKKRRIALARGTAWDCYDKITEFYDDEYVSQAIDALSRNLFYCVEWLYESLKAFCSRKVPSKTQENLTSFKKEFLEEAVNILAEKINKKTGSIEERREVETYLNLLLKQLYS